MNQHREKVRQLFDETGISISHWANQYGFRREDVYAVLSGRTLGKRGNSHEIAIALGLKPKPDADNPISKGLTSPSKSNE